MDDKSFKDYCCWAISQQYPEANPGEGIDTFDIDCLWVSHILQNNRGLFAARFNDGLLFDCLFDGNTKKLTVESYRRNGRKEFYS